MTAIGVVETVSIPLGVLAGDQMVKTAQVELVTAQTVCAGKYIVVVSGEVAAVRSAVAAGVESAASALVDSLVIANVDERVVAAMAGACPTEQVQAVGVMETFSLASSISAADTAVKAADVELIEVRLGRGMGGKSFVIVTGEVAAVEAAVQAAEGSEQTQGLISSSVVIPRRTWTSFARCYDGGAEKRVKKQESKIQKIRSKSKEKGDIHHDGSAGYD